MEFGTASGFGRNGLSTNSCSAEKRGRWNGNYQQQRQQVQHQPSIQLQQRFQQQQSHQQTGGKLSIRPKESFQTVPTSRRILSSAASQTEQKSSPASSTTSGTNLGVYESYTEAWNVASNLTRLRSLGSDARASAVTAGRSFVSVPPPRTSSQQSPRRLHTVDPVTTATENKDDSRSTQWSAPTRTAPPDRRQRSADSSATGMKLDFYCEVNGSSGHTANMAQPIMTRRPSTSEEIGSWIDKYQKSDHHVDRLVRTIVQYESATGEQFPDKKLLSTGGVYIKPKTTAYVSALPEVVYVKTPSFAGDGLVYADGQGQLRRLSVDRGSVSAAGMSKIVPGTVNGAFPVVQLPSSQSANISSRPPRYLSTTDCDSVTSRAASLPPAASLGADRRRMSISIAPTGSSPYRSRAGSIQGGAVGGYSAATLLPPRPSSIASGATSAVRRASYSGGSPAMSYGGSYRPIAAPVTSSRSYSRGPTPDRSSDIYARRPSVTSSTRPALSGLPGSRSSSIERNSAGATTAAVPMSDARRKIRQVLYKVSGDEDFLE